jgi:hypothetical protein
MIDLISLDEYKIYATIKSVEYDEKINAIISYVSSLVRTYCARNLIIEDPIVEYYNGGSSSVYTKEFPIVSITSIEYSTDYGQNYTSLVEFTDYVVNKAKDQLFLITEDEVELPNKYRITYIGGYEVIPQDLKIAILDLIDYYYKNETVPKRMSNFVTIEYVKTTDFPPHIKRILDLYRAI